MGHSTHTPNPEYTGVQTTPEVGTSSMALAADGQQIQPTQPSKNLIIDGVEIQPIPKENTPSSNDAAGTAAAANQYPSAPPLELHSAFIQPVYYGQVQGDNQAVHSMPLGGEQYGVPVQPPQQVTIVKANYRRRRCIIVTVVVVVIVVVISLGVGIGVGTRKEDDGYYSGTSKSGSSYSGYIQSKEYKFYTYTKDQICVTLRNSGDRTKFRVEIRSSYGGYFIASAETRYVSKYSSTRQCVELTSSRQTESQYTIVLDAYTSYYWKEVDRETFRPTNYPSPSPSPSPPPTKSYSGYILSKEYDKDTYSNDDICVTFYNSGDRAQFRVEIRSGTGSTFISRDETGYVSSSTNQYICVELTSSWESQSKYTVVLDVYTSSGWDEVDRESLYP